jgi:hypothetical protein
MVNVILLHIARLSGLEVLYFQVYNICNSLGRGSKRIFISVIVKFLIFPVCNFGFCF